MSDVTTKLAMEANDKAMEIARLKSENAELRNDAELLRAMLSQVQTEKRCYMAENAELRESLEYANNECEKESMEYLSTQDQNAKLRELVRLMWKPFCWAQSGYDVCLTDEQDRAIRDMVREMGVEVDG